MNAKHRIYASALVMIAGAMIMFVEWNIGFAVLLIAGAAFLRSFYDLSRKVE